MDPGKHSAQRYGFTSLRVVPTQVEAESARLYTLLQQSVDSQIQTVSFLPDGATYGMSGGESAAPARAAGNEHEQTDGPIHEQPGDHWVCSDKQKGLIPKLVEQHGLDKKEVEAHAREVRPAGYALGLLLIDPLYCAQEKFDGKRLLLRKQGNVVEGINRRGLIVSVPDTIAREAMGLPCDCLLDGEAVGDTPHVFDLLESGGIDHRKSPYIDRLGLLAGLIPDASTAIQTVYTAHAAREKIRLLEHLRREHKEGIVLKNLTAGHSPGKTSGSHDQYKYKFVESASFMATRVHPTKRSVSLGLHVGGEIVEAGRVTIPPNHDIPQAGSVVEVRYRHAFKQSRAIQQPCYLGEREDINPAECTTSQLKYRHEPAATIRV